MNIVLINREHLVPCLYNLFHYMRPKYGIGVSPKCFLASVIPILNFNTLPRNLVRAHEAHSSIIGDFPSLHKLAKILVKDDVVLAYQYILFFILHRGPNTVQMTQCTTICRPRPSKVWWCTLAPPVMGCKVGELLGKVAKTMLRHTFLYDSSSALVIRQVDDVDVVKVG